MATPARRGSLLTGIKAAADQVAAEEATQPAAPPGSAAGQRFSRDPSGMTTTAIHIPHAALALLRLVAVQRANREGGRPSVSSVLTDLVEQHRAALEREAKG